MRYWSTTKLLRELSTASADGSLARLLKQLERTDLLILDDWGLEQLKDAHAQLLLEILEDRQETGSMLITSQFAVGPGTSASATPLSPTPFWIGSSTTHTGSI